MRFNALEPCIDGALNPSGFFVRRMGAWERIHGWIILLVLLAFVSAAPASPDEMRFPAPEFESGYEFPETATPAAQFEWSAWVDVGVLFGALAIGAWLAVKRRSRRGMFWLMVFSLLYFGFYRQGCVCPIGSIQNVSFSLFGGHYAVPVTVAIFFSLPLLFALFAGRIFCGGVCPLGAIQDLVVLKPLNLPRKLTAALSMVPYVYLGVAVLFAATNTGFLICRYDPFIGFFRLNGNAPYLYLGAGFLLVGVFVARPYCRFFCPYGVLLGWMSRCSYSHLKITPTECVSCRLCEKSCPFDYIDKPNIGLAREPKGAGVKRLGYLFVMLPLLMVLGGWIGNQMAIPMSRYNRTVALAERTLIEARNPSLALSLETETFKASGTPEEQLFVEALAIRKRMKIGGWILGGFVGFVFGWKLIGVSTVRSRFGYEVRKADCFSCARCCSYCPSDDLHKVNFLAGSPRLQDALALERATPEKEALMEGGSA